MAPGSVQTGSIIVTPPASLPADSTVILDVEGYAGSALLGGFRVVYGSGSSTSTTIAVSSSTTTSVPFSTTTTTAGNTAPTAFFEVAPSIGTPETEFFVDASGSGDAEDSMQALLVLWDWETDGTWDTPLAAEKTAVHFYAAPGTYTITLLVEDSGGLTDTASQQVIVLSGEDQGNIPPDASFTVDPPEGDTSTVFTVDASASTDAETFLEKLKIRWDWESDGMWDTDFTPEKTATHLFELPDIHVITLEVVDEGGLNATATREVLVVSGDDGHEGDNTPPHALLYAEPPEGDTRTEFTFTAVDSTDAEDSPDALVVRWDFDSDGIWDTDFDPDKVALFRYAIPDLHTCTVEVMDTGGLTDQATVEVMVHERGVCPFGLLVEKEQLDTLRRFRDTVLAKSALGAGLIKSYYACSAMLVPVLEQHEIIRKTAGILLQGLLPVVDMVLAMATENTRGTQ
jgi:PKD repeat protein